MKPIVFGKYSLLKRIHVSGMAEIFLAKSIGIEGSRRTLAIKRILPSIAGDQEFIPTFIDEARLSVRLNHANVVQIEDLGQIGGTYYIAMEYVPGKDLRAVLERFRRRREIMPTAMALFIATRICAGLDYAHRKKGERSQDLQIIHRDISPENILLSSRGEVKLIGFGIAKAADRMQNTQPRILKGRLGYMSPEQVCGLPIDRRSDVFALGVILYEMLTGEELFVRESVFSTLLAVRNAEVTSPRLVNPNIPPALEKVMLKALARAVEDRYQWASELEEDLMSLLAREAIDPAERLSAFVADALAEDLLSDEERLQGAASVDRPVVPVSAPAGPSPPGSRPSRAPGGLTIHATLAGSTPAPRPTGAGSSGVTRPPRAPSPVPAGLPSAVIRPPIRGDPGPLTGNSEAPVRGIGGVFARVLRRLQVATISSRRQSPPVGQTAEHPVEVEPVPEAVFLGVSAPRVVKPRAKFVARFAAYVKGVECVLKARLEALSQDPSQVHLGFTPNQASHWKVGTPVTVRLSGDGFTCSPSQARFEWSGHENLLSFVVSASGDLGEGVAVLTFEASIEGVPVALIPLEIEVGATLDPSPRQNAAALARSGFASYASIDRSRVMDKLGALSAYDATLDIFTDCLDLRPGEVWKQRLEAVIPTREIFLLFWSRAAARSSWVEWEWRTALASKGIKAIHPVPLEAPQLAPPPPELSSLHFNDRYLMVRDAERRQAEKQTIIENIEPLDAP